jgi:hypothetical protein
MYAIFTEGYSKSNTQTGSSSIVDYIPSDPVGYMQDMVQYNTGRIDYLAGFMSYYSNVFIEQGSGWSVNWELINMPWETINNNWEL